MSPRIQPAEATLGAVVTRVRLAALDDADVRAAVRTGISTGTVVTGNRASGRTVTGEVVAEAARLAQAASPGEVVIGEGTAQLIRAAARLEPAEAEGWRLLELIPGAPAIPRRLEAAMVGRERELVQLRQAFCQRKHHGHCAFGHRSR